MLEISDSLILGNILLTALRNSLLEIFPLSFSSNSVSNALLFLNYFNFFNSLIKSLRFLILTLNLVYLSNFFLKNYTETTPSPSSSKLSNTFLSESNSIFGIYFSRLLMNSGLVIS